MRQAMKQQFLTKRQTSSDETTEGPEWIGKASNYVKYPNVEYHPKNFWMIFNITIFYVMAKRIGNLSKCLKRRQTLLKFQKKSWGV